ncbi:MAG TPA: YceD family protein [Allosphingosinicella sp.]|nr:YceD family protein [Allosphingosinicella sp.]
MTPEFSRPVRVDTLGQAPRSLSVEAEEPERRALAERFGLVAIDRLAADLSLTRAGAAVTAGGMLRAAVTQSCVASGAPVPADIEEPFTIEFRPFPEAGADEEVELGEEELDVVFYDGAMIDVGEAAAETLALALDPFPRSAKAAAALKEAGVKGEEEAQAESNPFAALAALRNKLK